MNLLGPMAIAALLAGLVTMLVTPAVKSLAHRVGVVRAPRDRDAHQKPTPLWGGLAMVVGFLAAFAGMRLFGNLPSPVADDPRPHLTALFGIPQHPILGILLGALLLAGIGALDDQRDLSPKIQTLGLLLAGLVAALFGARIEGVTNPLPNLIHTGPYLSVGGASVPLTLFWVFLATKTFDFLDGLDGLAAGVCAIAAVTMGLLAAFSRNPEPVVAVLAAALVGSALGFLRYNFNPASIFMGTIGSYFLGFMLAMLAVVGTFKVPAAVAVFLPEIVLGVPVFDALYVVGRRAAQGKKLTQADKSHIHHRLTERGLSVKQAVWAIYGLTITTCALALLLVWLGRK